jgi:hypothetical protein
MMGSRLASVEHGFYFLKLIMLAMMNRWGRGGNGEGACRGTADNVSVMPTESPEQRSGVNRLDDVNNVRNKCRNS